MEFQRVCNVEAYVRTLHRNCKAPQEERAPIRPSKGRACWSQRKRLRLLAPIKLVQDYENIRNTCAAWASTRDGISNDVDLDELTTAKLTLPQLERGSHQRPEMTCDHDLQAIVIGSVHARDAQADVCISLPRYAHPYAYACSRTPYAPAASRGR